MGDDKDWKNDSALASRIYAMGFRIDTWISIIVEVLLIIASIIFTIIAIKNSSYRQIVGWWSGVIIFGLLIWLSIKTSKLFP